MAKNNGHQNFTWSLGIPDPPPSYLGNIRKNAIFIATLTIATKGFSENLKIGITDKEYDTDLVSPFELIPFRLIRALLPNVWSGLITRC